MMFPRFAIILLLSALLPATAASRVGLPATGTLRVEVRDSDGRPLANAAVTVDGRGTAETDADGAAIFSDIGSVKPYAAVNVRVQSPGFDETVWKGVRVYAGQTTSVPMNLTRYGRPQTVEEPSHGLEQQGGHEGPPLNNARMPRAQGPVAPMPTYIRVFRIAKSQAAGTTIVDNILFENYVKGVVPAEWFPSWNAESLRAGAIAARTYGLRWVLSGGKYPNSTYPNVSADVSDTTATQVYNETRVASTNAAADATRGMVLVYGGSVISAEYSAENSDPTLAGSVPYEVSVAEPACHDFTQPGAPPKPRNGHGRGLCQWGSQYWATGSQGTDGPKNYTWILNHYYTSGSSVVVAGGGLAVDDCAVVSGNGTTAQSVRSSPSASASVVTTLPEGAIVHIIGGPTVVGSVTWWQVEAPMPAPNKVGWIPDTYLVETPCPPRVVALSNIAAGNVTNTGATVSWTSDVAASSVVRYGTSAGSLTNTATGAAGVTSHSVPLASLSPGTTYYYTVESGGTGLATTTSAVQSFSTIRPVIISGINTFTITEAGATVNWTTDVAASSVVRYGTAPGALSSSVSGAAGVTSHSVALTGLASGTTYYYAVESAAAGFTTTTSATQSFVTLRPVVISDIATTGLSETSATITWSTDLAASSVVRYGTSEAALSSTATGASGATSHFVPIGGLAPNTTYYFTVESGGPGLSTVVSTVRSFATLRPVVITAVAAQDTTASASTITWTTDVAASSVVRYGTSAGALTETASGAAGTSHSVSLSTLAAATTYYFTVQSGGAGLSSATSAVQSFTTLAQMAISSVAVQNVTSNAATIVWTTNIPATGIVRYGDATGPPYASTATGEADVTAHSVTLSGLTPGQTVHFSAESSAANATTAASADAAFTTLPAPGDVDGNGAVDMADVTLSLQVAAGMADVTAAQRQRADLSGGDALVTLDDALVLLRAVTGAVPLP